MKTGKLAHLEEAVLVREPLEPMPPPSPNRSSAPNNLAKILSQRFQKLGHHSGWKEVARLRHEASQL